MRVQLRHPVRRPRRARWTAVVALFVASFVAFVPIADAFCAMDLPLANLPSSTLPGDTDHAPAGHDPDPCCESMASLLAVSDCKADDLATGAVRSFDRPLVLVARVYQPPIPTLPRARVRIGIPPAPEPLFLRLKRLLI
jgi:hypothetical protein